MIDIACELSKADFSRNTFPTKSLLPEIWFVSWNQNDLEDWYLVTVSVNFIGFDYP